MSHLLGTVGDVQENAASVRDDEERPARGGRRL